MFAVLRCLLILAVSACLLFVRCCSFLLLHVVRCSLFVVGWLLFVVCGLSLFAVEMCSCVVRCSVVFVVVRCSFVNLVAV